MKTIQKISIWLILASLLGSLLTSCGNRSENSSSGGFTIAVADAFPFDEKGNIDPRSYYAGALLAVNQANDQGGVNGSEVNLKSYDDQGKPAMAAENAREIVSSPALAVIGHSSSETTAAAAAIYDEAKIPAINVIPDSANLTADHKAYFNISHSADLEAIYIANYLAKVLKVVDGEGNMIPKYATIIHADDRQSMAVAEAFRNTFQGLGGIISLERKVPADSTMDSRMEEIVTEIVGLDTSVQNPGTIFIAMPGDMAAKLVVQIKRKGLVYPLAGGSSLTSSEFTDFIKSQGEESTQPGYFTDGILTVRAVIGDSIQGQTRKIFDSYASLYPQEIEPPSDAFLAGYEAALAVMGAARKTDLSGDAASDRAAIMESLTSLGSGSNTLQGITGTLVFRQNRNAIRTPRFGTYQNGQLISAMTQFKRIGGLPYSAELQGQIDSGQVMTVNGEYVNVVNVVYTGIDLLSVREVDIKTSTYKLDFYLWFRYRENADQKFKPDDYSFTNNESIDSEVLVGEETSGGITLKTYRIQGQFKNQFNFQDYPFDRQNLTMQLRNKDATTSEIQYVVDKLGMKYSSDASLLLYWENNQAFTELFGWIPRTAQAEQQIFSTSSTLGNPENFGQSGTTDYSLFDVDLEIQRNSLSFIIKSLLPLLITLVLAYITFFLPLGHSERLGVGSTALLTTAFFHLNLASALPEIGYTVAMEYFFYASYLMSALIVFLETLSIRLEKQGEDEKDEAKKAIFENKRNKLNMTGRIIYPSILGLAILLGIFVAVGALSMSPDLAQAGRDLASQVTKPVPTPAPVGSQTPGSQTSDANKTTLVMMTWRPEDTNEMETILAAFSAYALEKHQREIVIKYEPIMSVNYDSILSAKFGDETNAPDLIYVRPYSVDGSIAEYLMPLDAAQLKLEENYKPQMLEPWLSANGKYYGIPFGGVVQGIYYNKDLFAKAGVEIPKTWDGLLEASRKLKEYSDTLRPEQRFVPIANGLNDRQDSEMFQSIVINFIRGAQGRKDLLEGATCFNNTRIVGAFGAIEQLKPYLPADAAGLTAEASKELFFKQKAAMVFGGSWDVKLVTRQAGFQWGVFAPPSRYGDSFVIFNPDAAIGINNNTRYKAEALLFAEWLTSQEAVNLIAENLPGFYPLSELKPVSTSTGPDAEFLELATTYETDARWVYIGISNAYPRADEIVRVALFDVLKDEITADEAASRLQAGLAEWFKPAQICK